MSLLKKAFEIAHAFHNGQFRKDGITPYFVHPVEVMRLLQSCGEKDEEVLAAALCHDLLEDTKCFYTDIETDLGKNVAELVEELTFTFSTVYETKQKYLESFATKSDAAVRIKAADRLCNTKDFVASGDRKYAAKYLNKAECVFKTMLDRYSKDNRGYKALSDAEKVMRNLYLEYMALDKELVHLYKVGDGVYNG